MTDMHTLLRQLLILMLAITTMPGVVEIASAGEPTEHAAHEHEEHHDDGDEGCTSSAHDCHCHVSTMALLGTGLELPSRVEVLSADHSEHVARPCHRANAPPVPPPTA